MSPPEKMDQAISGSALAGNLTIIEEAAKSVRRMRADEDFDDEGIRTIWHRGRQQTEMLSWEDKDKVITRQELSLFGMVINYRQGTEIRTGAIPASESLTTGGKPSSARLDMDKVPNPETLECASHLLKHVKGRDFYAQHLLKHVNEAIAKHGYDVSRTAVAKVDSFSRQHKDLPTMAVHREDLVEPTKIVLNPAGGSGRLLIYAGLLALAGVGAGILLGYLLGFM